MNQMRRVVESLPTSNIRVRVLRLSCGHTKTRYGSVPRMTRCRQCETTLDKPQRITTRSKADRQKQEKTAAVLFSQIIKLRDRTCTMNGRDDVRCKGVLDCAHVITRGNHVLRFDTDNAHTLCRQHHTYYHANEALWIEVCKREWPQATLHCLSVKNRLETDEDLDAIITNLRELKHQLENGK